jgi:hypothetical protein
VTITPAIEVAKETVAQIMLPTDSIDRVYRRRIPGRIAMVESTVIAVNRKTQLLRRNLIVGRPEDLGQLGGYRDRGFFLRLSHVYFRPSREGLAIFQHHFPAKRFLNPHREEA